jgi:hypothetical protein
VSERDGVWEQGRCNGIFLFEYFCSEDLFCGALSRSF